MALAHSSLPSEGHRLFLQLRSELHAVMCTRSRPEQPLLEPDWRSSLDLTCISSSTRTWDRAAGERDQRSGEIELAEKDRIEPFVLLDLAVLVIRFPSSSFSPLTCCRGTTLCGGQSLLSPELHDHAPRGLLMTSKFDPDGLVKRRTLRPSQSGIALARDLEGVAGQNSCFLRSQPAARWERRHPLRTGAPILAAPKPPGVLKKGTAFCELKPATLAKMLMKETGLMTPTPCGQPTSRRRWSEPPRWRPPSRSMGFVGVDRS